MNINEEVVVKLTKEGFDIYDTFCFRKYQLAAPILEGYSFRLVELMQIFGPGLFTGCKSFFVDDEVQIVQKV